LEQVRGLPYSLIRSAYFAAYLILLVFNSGLYSLNQREGLKFIHMEYNQKRRSHQDPGEMCHVATWYSVCRYYYYITIMCYWKLEENDRQALTFTTKHAWQGPRKKSGIEQGFIFHAFAGITRYIYEWRVSRASQFMSADQIFNAHEPPIN
jgi:hypothetical protein